LGLRDIEFLRSFPERMLLAGKPFRAIPGRLRGQTPFKERLKMKGFSTPY